MLKKERQDLMRQLTFVENKINDVEKKILEAEKEHTSVLNNIKNYKS